jgi:crotonobetainyl-CoA:carnitine CoA-transferase CaiB-like acyl-CoA transferase
MLSFEAQQRAREALRKLDQALGAAITVEGELQKHAEGFRETMFSAFQFLEGESMSLQELQVKMQRTDKQQIHVQSKGRYPFILMLDPEAAYDTRPPAQGQSAEAAPAPELAARMFAVLAAPYQGVLRYYTIFADGTWKRTTFAASASGVQTRSALVGRYTADVLVLEAVDLLGYACTMHPTWDPLNEAAETLNIEGLRQRTTVKTHLSGLGANRRH